MLADTGGHPFNPATNTLRGLLHFRIQRDNYKEDSCPRRTHARYGRVCGASAWGLSQQGSKGQPMAMARS